ncbi:MAG: hypothetical protein VZR31_06735 [Lachnospiraceae bacterium]|nr:hypothetical protein [Lachnospiraceae bacterium]
MQITRPQERPAEYMQNNQPTGATSGIHADNQTTGQTGEIHADHKIARLPDQYKQIY